LETRAAATVVPIGLKTVPPIARIVEEHLGVAMTNARPMDQPVLSVAKAAI
jgi:hypothetical protein